MRYLERMKSLRLVACLAVLSANIAAAQAAPPALPKSPKPPAQDVDAHDMPVEARSPVTGEPGTWIPDWLKLRHLQDNERLKQCTVDLSLADDEWQLQADQLEHLHAALHLEMKAGAKLELSLAASEQDRSLMQVQVRRRTTAMWVLLGGLAAVAGLLTFEVAR